MIKNLARCGALVLMTLAAGACSKPEHDAAPGGDTLQPAAAATPTPPPAGPWTPDCQRDIAAIEQRITALESLPPPYTVDAVLHPLNDIEIAIADGASFASLMENVHPDREVREHAALCTTAYSDLATRLGLSRPVFDAVSQVAVEAAPDDTKRYHFLTLQGFRLSGVDRDEGTRARIRELNDRITKLGQEFDRNILEDVGYIEVAPEDLAGLPEDFIAGKPVGDNGKIRISTRYVDSIPVYTYAHSDEVRRLLRQKERSRAYPQNEEVLGQLLAARHQLAQLLGFANYADLVTNDKMIASADNARGFIDRIDQLARPAADRDVARLLDRLRQIDPDASQVERWQTTYLEELIRREDYSIDATELRQYFPYTSVRDGMFRLVEHLFDVTIKPWTTEVWHHSVTSYEIYQGDQLLGRFHLDMHPRDGKYQHAAAFVTQLGIAGRQLPVSTLVCNFAGGEGANELMEYGEVRTFLHEFGHLLHAIFGGHQNWARLSGIATEWDFVEAPSQMLEEWLYDRDTLQSFAINAQGQTIPGDLVDRLKAARNFGEGAQTRVQMYYSALSLDYHSDDPASFNLVARMRELEARYSPFPHQDNTYFFANLGHLNGYSAIYYTYMWSKVIAVDMFSAFEDSGLRNKDLAGHYRKTVLAPGGAKPAAQLVEDFLGRPYSFAAFSARLEEE